MSRDDCSRVAVDWWKMGADRSLTALRDLTQHFAEVYSLDANTVFHAAVQRIPVNAISGTQAASDWLRDKTDPIA